MMTSSFGGIVEELKLFLVAFIPLFVAIDPIGLSPIFMWMTRETAKSQARRTANLACITALLVCLLFLFLGKVIFEFLGITVYDFQIAGGLILFALAARDIIGQSHEAPVASSQSVGVVPLGMPLIAGPASITTLLILIDSVGLFYTIVSLVVNLTLVYIGFRFSKYFTKIGTNALTAFSKIISLLLAAISVNMILKGVQALFL